MSMKKYALIWVGIFLFVFFIIKLASFNPPVKNIRAHRAGGLDWAKGAEERMGMADFPENPKIFLGRSETRYEAIPIYGARNIVTTQK